MHWLTSSTCVVVSVLEYRITPMRLLLAGTNETVTVCSTWLLFLIGSSDVCCLLKMASKKKLYLRENCTLVPLLKDRGPWPVNETYYCIQGSDIVLGGMPNTLFTNIKTCEVHVHCCTNHLCVVSFEGMHILIADTSRLNSTSQLSVQRIRKGVIETNYWLYYMLLAVLSNYLC